MDLARTLLDTRAAWANICPGHVARMGGGNADADLPDRTVAPFRRPEIASADGLWAAARARLAAEDRRCSMPGSRA